MSLFAPIVGAITALPVVAVFAIGLSMGDTRAAVSMAIGANLIAVLSLVGAPRIPIGVALFDVLAIGMSTFVGSATAPYTWLHIVMLVPWCLGAGILVASGATYSVIGTHAIIAYVVLGRFSGSSQDAARLTLLIVIGACVEIVALLVLRLPPSLRYQRNRLADALDALAVLAQREPNLSSTDTAHSLDVAEHALSVPSLFGRTDVNDLRSVLDQARRMRFELTTVAGLRARLTTTAAAEARTSIEACLQGAATTLRQIGVELRQTRQLSNWNAAAMMYRDGLTSLEHQFATDDPETVIARQSVDYLAALGGQIRAAGNLIDAALATRSRAMWRTRITPHHGPVGIHLQSGLSTLPDRLRRSPAATRHAIRLAVAVPCSLLIGSALSLPRSYWLPFSVAVVLRPDYGSLFTKGIARLVGTLLGATLSAVLISELHPGAVAETVLVALTAWAAYATWAASFSVAVGWMTALVLILLSTSLTDTVSTALDRLIDFSLGGAIAIVTYLAWPTSPRANVDAAESALFSSLGDYLSLVLDLVAARPVDLAELAARSNAARQAWTKAEEIVRMSMQEPASTRIGASEGQGLIAASLRTVRAIHALKIEAERGASLAAFDEFDLLAAGLLQALTILANGCTNERPDDLADLRGLYRRAEPRLVDAGAPPSIALHLDELVNAIGTAAHLIGIRTAFHQ